MAKKPEIEAVWTPTPALRAAVRVWARAHDAQVDNKPKDFDGIIHPGTSVDWLPSLLAIVPVRQIIAFHFSENEVLAARATVEGLGVRFLYLGE